MSTPVTSYSPEVRSSRYLNRELSWLEFDRRVLAMAEDPALPLLERVKFLAIFSQNLDEFFQVRVALLQAELESGVTATPADGMTPEQQLDAIRERVVELAEVEQQIFKKELRPALAAAGLEICDWERIGKRDRKHLAAFFDKRIFPVLTPLAVDPAHPFPYVSNLSFNLAALVRNPKTGTVRFARIKVPPLLGRFIPLPDGDQIVPIEQLIAAHLDQLFPGMEIVSHCPFRVTRDADLDIESDDAENLLLAVESGVKRRRRLSDAVRVEADKSMSAEVRDLLLEELELDENDFYVRHTLLDLGSLWELYRVERPDLKAESWASRPVATLSAPGEEPFDVFERLRQGDVLVHHPYDSFDSSVEAFLAHAAADPDVLAIKHTLYRTSSGAENPIGRTLMRAAQNGKQVVTLVELQARFDEEANIEWARTLEQAGVHVVYGLVGLKTHGKVMLVVRREDDQIRGYCHVGTGNYHPVTARLYEDVGILSADPDLAADLTELFNQLTGYSLEPKFRRILRAPDSLRSGLIELIRQEMAVRDGRIVIKVNNLSDPALIDALYEASSAGVKIDLIVRSICCLRAGVPGLSENIRVRSVVGRYLEHSRLFRFGSAKRGRRYFLGSADLMPRNLDRRVEVVTPVEAPELKARLEEIFDLLLADDALAWELEDHAWRKVPVTAGLDCQVELQKRAVARSRSD
ncbi:MAG: polyphosphate kinase 1 [Myxococcota bacterium]